MKAFTFYRLAVFSAILSLSLASILIFSPSLMLTGWGLELSTDAGLMMKRIGALYAGIAVMFFLARNAEHSPTRSALIYGFATACIMLAALGMYEFALGHATSGMLISVFIEVALVLAFLCVNASRA